jgi:hypothetical protein
MGLFSFKVIFNVIIVKLLELMGPLIFLQVHRKGWCITIDLIRLRITHSKSLKNQKKMIIFVYIFFI